MKNTKNPCEQEEPKIGMRDKGLTLPNERILDVTKLKAFADDNLNITTITISLYHTVEGHCGKRRKCWLPAFSPSPTAFSKAFFFRVDTCHDCEVKSQVIILPN